MKHTRQRRSLWRDPAPERQLNAVCSEVVWIAERFTAVASLRRQGECAHGAERVAKDA
jgi:phage-related protein